jgi:hypothetical protein
MSGLREQRARTSEGRGELPQGQPVITKRRTLVLGAVAGEFIGRAKRRSYNQYFFRRPLGIEPLSTASDALMTGSGCNGGKAH